VYLCFVWIWKETAIISLYSINWLVFIAETECVYCAVWTLHYVMYIKPLKPSGHSMYHEFNINNSTLCPQCIYVLCGSENKQRLLPHTALTDWFLKPSRKVFTARYEVYLHVQLRQVSSYKASVWKLPIAGSLPQTARSLTPLLPTPTAGCLQFSSFNKVKLNLWRLLRHL